MAENHTGPRNLVRDMYEGVNPGEMSERDKKAHKERNLQRNPDVLFRIYQRGRLHMLLLRTAHAGEWMTAIQTRITTSQSFQLTKRRTVNNIFTITLAGPQEELRRFCDEFDQLHDGVMESIQDGGAAAQGNPGDELEELRQRIGELELENQRLRRQ